MTRNEEIEKQVTELIKTGTQIYNGAIDEAVELLKKEICKPVFGVEDQAYNNGVEVCISKLYQLKKEIKP